MAVMRVLENGFCAQVTACGSGSDGMRGDFTTSAQRGTGVAPAGLAFTSAALSAKSANAFDRSTVPKGSPAANLCEVTTRSFAATVLLLEAVFVALIALAMARYPGGTWCDPAAVGHRFWQNFLCDLLHVRSLSGAANPGAGLARLAMLALIAGFLPFWLVLPALFPLRRRTALWLRRIGAISVCAMALVPLTPSDRFGSVHGLVVMSAGAPGFAAAALAVWAELATPSRRWLGALGAAMLGFSFADMAIYAHHYFGRVDCSPVLPLVQRIALVLVLAWMAASSVALLRSRP
jgi:hypothetical protein